MLMNQSNKIVTALGLVAMMSAGSAVAAQSTVSAGAVSGDGETGFVFGTELQPHATPTVVTETYLRQIDYKGVETITFKGGIGFGTNLPDQVGHTVSGLVGVRVDNYDGFADEYGFYTTGKYRYDAMDNLTVGGDLTYTAMDENALIERSGVTIEPMVAYQFTKGVSLEGRYLVDVGDVEGDDLITANLKLAY